MTYDPRTARDEPDGIIGYYCQWCRGNGTTISRNRVRYVTVLHKPDCELLLYLRARHPALMGEGDGPSGLQGSERYSVPIAVGVPFLPPN